MVLGTGFNSWAPALRHDYHKINCVASGLAIDGVRHLLTIGHIISNVLMSPHLEWIAVAIRG